MKLKRNQKGFTLIEILLVVTILGFMLAVILPRGLRTSVDAKYSLLRKHCTELAGYANQWAEEQLLAQDSDSITKISKYYKTLVENDSSSAPSDGTAAWIADNTHSNWNEIGAPIEIQGRKVGGVDNRIPETSVEGMIEPSMIPRNPFNGGNVFLYVNQPSAVATVPGAIACSTATDNSLGTSKDYYALIFQGTDSTTGNIDPTLADFHAGMRASTIFGLRNGIFLAKVSP